MMQRDLPRRLFTQQAEAEAEANNGEDVHFSRCDASRVLCGWGVTRLGTADPADSARSLLQLLLILHSAAALKITTCE